MEIKSRILQFINKELMIELNSITMDVLIPDNNTKINLMIAALEKHNVPYQELGGGTNRMAFFIDGYVFKIAMDKAGIIDNWAEFSLSQELQPFVTRTYECNGLITVAEYVTVISKDEFQNSKEEVRQILSHLSDSYLLGDVGSINKNFMNWGYRNDGSLVILDFAYIYRVIGDELICGGLNKDDTICDGSLEYDENFHKLICPKCRKTYTFHEIRRKINKEYEEQERESIKKLAYKVTKPLQEFNSTNDSTTIMNDKTNKKGDTNMGKNKYFDTDFCEEENVQFDDDIYAEAIEFMKEVKSSCVETVEESDPNTELITDMDQINDTLDEYDEDSNEDTEIIDNDDDDDDGMTVEDIYAIINHESSIEEANDELEDETGVSDEELDAIYESDDDNDEEINDSDIVETFDNIDTGDVISTEEVIESIEEDFSESEKMDNSSNVEDDSIEAKFTIATPHDETVEDESDTTITVETEDAEIEIVSEDNSINVNVSVSEDTESPKTAKLEVGDDTIVLTTPENVDEMRAMLAVDLATPEEEYDDMYDDFDRGTFQKIPKKKKDFN